jgi:hypothetical protein
VDAHAKGFGNGLAEPLFMGLPLSSLKRNPFEVPELPDLKWSVKYSPDEITKKF